MKKFCVTAFLGAASALALSTSASAITVGSGEFLQLQVTGSYEVVGGGRVEAGSTLNITQFSSPFGSVDPFVSSIGSSGGVDRGGIQENDLTSGFVGDQIFVGTGVVPTFAFNVNPTGPGAAGPITFVSTSTINTPDTVLPSTSISALVLEGEGTFGGFQSSWSFSLTSTNPTGSFTMSLDTPPAIELPPVPLPASVLMLGGALAGFGLFGYVGNARRREDA